MVEKSRFYQNTDEKNLKKLLKTLQSNTHIYKPNQTIAYSISNRELIGIIEEGTANLVRYDYDGKRSIIEEMGEGDIFSDLFLAVDSAELSVISTTECKVTFIEYNDLMEEAKKSNTALTLLDNLIQLMARKLVKRNERIELLTTRSIRNKLLNYFELQAKKNNSKSFNLRYSYTDLADYLSVDRSAMMRELKNLKDDRLITDTNKKITILY
ncbi:MAG: Crp/Fnr family transcriptional regulator [Bacilli bacterium]|nr:Crp/Fnr family transcriptional regulator [Bacilli bacterium]